MGNEIMSNALVSIIITTYGNSRWLKRAMDSVINQTYSNIEIIVVDDNNPNTRARITVQNIIQQYMVIDERKIKYIQHSHNRNGANARNTGIKYANGDYLGFLDDDDVFLPTKIEKCVNYLIEHKSVNMILTNVLFFSNGFFTSTLDAPNLERLQYDILNGSESIGTGSNLFFTKTVIDTIGLFDSRFTRYQDLEYTIRVLDKFHSGYINDILIIKAGDGRNYPNYSKLLENDKLFLEKFKGLINTFSVPERNKIYQYHAETLFFRAVETSGVKLFIDQEYWNLKEIGDIKMKVEESYIHWKSIYLRKKIKHVLKQNSIIFSCYCWINKVIHRKMIKEYKLYWQYIKQ